MTILQLAANRWWTGSAEPVTRLVVGLRARGHRVLLGIIRGDRFEAKARAAGIEPLDTLSLDGTSPQALARDLARLRRIVRDEAVEIVHAHHSHDHWLAGLTRGGAAVVRTFHNARAVRAGFLASWLYSRTDAAIAVSGSIGAACAGAGFGSRRVFRVRGVTDVARFSLPRGGRAIRDEFKIGDAPTIGCVARLAASRGHGALLAGFRELLTRLPEARLMLVGKGEARSAVEAGVVELGLAERVIFAGYRDHDLPEVLAALDCVVLMAAGSDESCRAALEAMAAGCPVVAPRIGALPEMIVHGETGWLLDDGRPETVAGALEAVIRDRARARAMGLAARRRAVAEFSPEVHVEDTERIYAAVLARARPSVRPDTP